MIDSVEHVAPNLTDIFIFHAKTSGFREDANAVITIGKIINL